MQTQESQCDTRYVNAALETAVCDKMRQVEILKEKLRAEESTTRALRAEKLDVELDLKTLEKINSLQEKKLEILE